MEWGSLPRWIIVAFVAFVAMSYSLSHPEMFNDMRGYVQSWGGAMFKTMTGGCLGYGFSRWVVGLDVSKEPPERRPLAGLSLALYIAAGMIGVPLGS